MMEEDTIAGRYSSVYPMYPTESMTNGLLMGMDNCLLHHESITYPYEDPLIDLFLEGAYRANGGVKSLEATNSLSSELNYPYEEPPSDVKYVNTNLELGNNETGSDSGFPWNGGGLTTNISGDYLFPSSTNSDLDKPKIGYPSSVFSHPEGLYDDMYTDGNGTKTYVRGMNGFVEPTTTATAGVDELRPTRDLLGPKEPEEITHTTAVENGDQPQPESTVISTINNVPESSSSPVADDQISATRTTTTIDDDSVRLLGPGTVLVTSKATPLDDTSATALKTPPSTPTVTTAVHRSPTGVTSPISSIPTHLLKKHPRYSDEFTDKSRLVHRKERNRIAAKRCRQRKAEYVHDLEHQLDMAQHQIHQLQEDIRRLRDENDKFRHSLPNIPLPTYDLRHKKK